jgi:hypothetical protein
MYKLIFKLEEIWNHVCHIFVKIKIFLLPFVFFWGGGGMEELIL